MAEHYGCAVVPARVRWPKDKAAVEMSVGVVERRVISTLRSRVFVGLGELADAIEEAVDRVIIANSFRERTNSASLVVLVSLFPGRLWRFGTLREGRVRLLPQCCYLNHTVAFRE